MLPNVHDDRTYSELKVPAEPAGDQIGKVVSSNVNFSTKTVNVIMETCVGWALRGVIYSRETGKAIVKLIHDFENKKTV